METTGLVLQLYREKFGQIPLLIDQSFAPLDVAAALTSDRKTLTIGVVNPTDAEVEINDAAQEVMTTNTVHQSLWARVKELEADIRSMSREWDIKLEESEAVNKFLADDLKRSRLE